MSRCWLALVDGPAPNADATAAAFTLDGAAAGTLAAWRRPSKPIRQALRVDERLIDPGGAPALISLVIAPRGVRLPFDDPAVQQARRLVLMHSHPEAVSTLLRDDSHFEGAITVYRSPHMERCLHDDPFARIYPAKLLAIDAGILGSVAAPAGPAIERYGSGNPWPCDRFD
jgi:hypothetical protein